MHDVDNKTRQTPKSGHSPACACKIQGTSSKHCTAHEILCLRITVYLCFADCFFAAKSRNWDERSVCTCATSQMCSPGLRPGLAGEPWRHGPRLLVIRSLCRGSGSAPAAE